MSLLTDDLRTRLPPLLSQEAEGDPMVYARFHLPGSRQAWYLIEGEPDGDDYVFFGFVFGPEDEFARFRLSELDAEVGPSGETVERDLTFIGGRLTDVVPAPDF
jgi:Protein of unknown function (DUF2958)